MASQSELNLHINSDWAVLNYCFSGEFMVSSEKKTPIYKLQAWGHFLFITLMMFGFRRANVVISSPLFLQFKKCIKEISITNICDLLYSVTLTELLINGSHFCSFKTRICYQ